MGDSINTLDVSPQAIPAAVEEPHRPVARESRIGVIDVLRGFALLGILVMNINNFAFPMAAYSNPRLSGGADGINLVLWFLQRSLFEGKMRGMFSMIFGASMVLLITRLERKGAGIGAADIYYRRILWLLLFGMAHAYLIWWGDILFPYAMLGLILFPMRLLQPRALLIAATIQILILTGFSVGYAFDLKSKRQEGLAAEALKQQNKTLTREQQDQLKSWEDMRDEADPTSEKWKKEVAAMHGNYLAVFKHRAGVTWNWHRLPLYFPIYFDMMAFMLMGIALFKTGFLTGEAASATYWKTLCIGGVAGLAIDFAGSWIPMQNGYDPVVTAFANSAHHLARVGLTLAFASAIILTVRAGRMMWFTRRLSAVGQTAFSNYILTSVIASIIFYGYGFGLFDRVQRWQAYLIVLAIWSFNLIASPIWLRHYRFGPLEWGWRSLVYWKRQPMRIAPPEAAPLTAMAASTKS